MGTAVGIDLSEGVAVGGTSVGVAVEVGGTGVDVPVGNGMGAAVGGTLVGVAVGVGCFVGCGFGDSFVGDGSTSTLASGDGVSAI